MIFSSKIQKMLLDGLKGDFKRNLMDPLRYTFKAYPKYSIRKDILYYENKILSPLTSANFLTMYQVVTGDGLHNFNIVNTYKTAYMITYDMAFNPIDSSVTFHAVVSDRDYNVDYVSDIKNLVDLMAVTMAIMEVLKKNKYISEDDKILEI